MKIIKLLTGLFLIGFITVSVCTAEEEKEAVDYREFLDIVSEWTPYGDVIQVGDTLISDFDSVWIDNGGKDLMPAGKGDIKIGKLARVILNTKDDENRWSAHKIILFSGKKLESVVELLPGDMKKEYLRKN